MQSHAGTVQKVKNSKRAARESLDAACAQRHTARAAGATVPAAATARSGEGSTSRQREISTRSRRPSTIDCTPEAAGSTELASCGAVSSGLRGLASAVSLSSVTKPNVAQGWTTLSLQQSGMFFFVCLILAVLSEYVGTILGEVRSRPLYFMAEEANSSVLLEDTVRSSIVNDSDG